MIEALRTEVGSLGVALRWLEIASSLEGEKIVCSEAFSTLMHVFLFRENINYLAMGMAARMDGRKQKREQFFKCIAASFCSFSRPEEYRNSFCRVF